MWDVKNLLVLTQVQLLNEINQWYPTGTSEQFLRMLDGEVQSITSMIVRANDLLSDLNVITKSLEIRGLPACAVS